MNETTILDSAQKMCDNIEENFITLGELLSQIKEQKLFRFKGYESFRMFVETEYHMAGAKATRLAKVFNTFITELGMDEQEIRQLGFDKLSLITPIVAKVDYKQKHEWVEKADELPMADLKDAIKEYKQANKPVDAKKVFTEQMMEMLKEWLDCNNKMLQYYLALYFHNADADTVVAQVKENMKKFEAMLIAD